MIVTKVGEEIIFVRDAMLKLINGAEVGRFRSYAKLHEYLADHPDEKFLLEGNKMGDPLPELPEGQPVIYCGTVRYNSATNQIEYPAGL